jgi:hypothetical protein
VVVKLPEVPANERITIGAKPHGRPGATGRVQVDMTVGAGGEALLSFALYLNVNQPARPGAPNLPGAGPVPPPSAPAQPGAAGAPVGTEILVQPRQRVEMQVHSGGLKVTAIGEAQQAGKLGQTIPVQNVDSKKVLSGRVTGPGTVEIDLGGAP